MIKMKMSYASSRYASHERAYKDENYISHEPGIFPDLLVPVDRDWVYANNI